MTKKEVTITGLTVNKQMGILKACQLTFNDGRLVVVKGATGEGKTTLQTAVKLGTNGSKSLNDKSLYGDIDMEVQLLDGDMPVYVGCKTGAAGELQYVLYTRDTEGKKVKDPVIDGVKATPAKYLEMLQTQLTWRIDELMSDNSVVQRKILLDLYGHELAKVGVVFDKKSPAYNGSLLWKIEQAEKDRDYADMERKKNGGILEDMKAQGINPDVAVDEIDLKSIDEQIAQRNAQHINAKQNWEHEKQKQLQEIKLKAAAITQWCYEYNGATEMKNDHARKMAEVYNRDQDAAALNINKAVQAHMTLLDLGYTGGEVAVFIDSLPQANPYTSPDLEDTIRIDNGVVMTCGGMPEAVNEKFLQLITMRNDYTAAEAAQYTEEAVDMSDLDMLKQNAEQHNKVCKAVQTYRAWSNTNAVVIGLKQEYYRLLKSINTGVVGMSIEEIDGDIYLMYNGSYDPAYFKNEKKEARKLSSYSGTQKPIICLLVQEYMLSLKPKALRYMFIDNIPMDNKTQQLLTDICEKLNLRIFLNITGDYDKNSLKYGEILVENGQLFFTNN